MHTNLFLPSFLWKIYNKSLKQGALTCNILLKIVVSNGNYFKMRSPHVVLLTVFSTIALINREPVDTNWIIEKHKEFNLIYTLNDKKNKEKYAGLVENGLASAKTFFNSPYNKPFDIYIHPDRHSLDSTWQKDWNMPGFKSECWMVASGIATRLDVISPVLWDREACEHVYAETKKTQQLITHELIHVYHGQLNASPDFSKAEGIDWFVEGLATYGSGQCNSTRIAEIKKAISDNKTPNGLDEFWTGKLKYGLSGSVVMFIDNRYGRSKLIELLPFNRKADILSTLNTTESELLVEWKKYIQKL